MATPRDIRRLAFQALYQIDTSGAADADTLEASLDPSVELRDSQRRKVIELAMSAYSYRDAADEEFARLAPDWPARRQAAADRAILRLAHYELTATDTPAAMVINDAVELAKTFSTERSPAFVNALLDKVRRREAGAGVGEA